MNEVIATDRYQALGIPYPDPSTMCKGQCEGTGYFPHSMEWRGDARIDALWERAHAEGHTLRRRLLCLWRALIGLDRTWFRMAFKSCDGWHFLRCPDCNGTGKAEAR